MSDTVAWISATVSAASVAVAVAAFVKSSRAQREANVTQQRLVEIEDRRDRDRKLELCRARLVALNGQGLIRIENQGLGEGRDIVVLADGRPFIDHERMSPFRPMPLHRLAARCNCDYRVVAFDGAPPIEFDITWTDDTGEQGRFQHSLQV